MSDQPCPACVTTCGRCTYECERCGTRYGSRLAARECAHFDDANRPDCNRVRR